MGTWRARFFDGSARSKPPIDRSLSGSGVRSSHRDDADCQRRFPNRVCSPPALSGGQECPRRYWRRSGPPPPRPRRARDGDSARWSAPARGRAASPIKARNPLDVGFMPRLGHWDPGSLRLRDDPIHGSMILRDEPQRQDATSTRAIRGRQVVGCLDRGPVGVVSGPARGEMLRWCLVRRWYGLPELFNQRFND